MAHYRCIRCGGESDDKETIDHARGLIIGRPCKGGDSLVRDISKKAAAQVETPTEIPTKKTKTKGKP